MTSIARSDVEILIHTTAPSRGSDDARYRALAQAYLDFKPLVRQRFEEFQAVESLNDADYDVDEQFQDERRRSTQEDRESKASYRPEDTQEQETATTDSHQLQAFSHPSLFDDLISPQLSFSSVLDNADSPSFRRPTTLISGPPDYIQRRQQVQSPGSEDSWQPSPSVVLDSQPEGSRADIPFASASGVLDRYLLDIKSSGEALPRLEAKSHATSYEFSPRPSAEEEYGPSTFSGRVERIQPTLSGGPSSHPVPVPAMSENPNPTASSAIQQELPPPLPTTKRKRIPEGTEPAKSVSSNPPSISAVEAPPSQNNRSAKRPRTGTEPTSPQPQLRSSSIPLLSKQYRSPTSHSLTIHPPPPPTSISPSPMHHTSPSILTPSLLHLSSKMSLDKLYNPKSQIRDLRPLERGYWRVDMYSWDEGLRARCWDCLERFVCVGKAGWGVWGIWEGKVEEEEEVGGLAIAVERRRDKRDGRVEGEGGGVENRHEDANREGNKSGNETRGGTILRVYCWGTVVGYIYLLLYMASESKIRRAEAVWIGGDGEVVVRMN